MLDLVQASFRFLKIYLICCTTTGGRRINLNVHMLDLIHYFILLIYCVNTRCICISNSSVYHMHYYLIVKYWNWILGEIILINKLKHMFVVHFYNCLMMFVTYWWRKAEHL